MKTIEKLIAMKELREMKKAKDALKFAATARGSYIIGQALYIAATELDKVPDRYKEVSNIADMHYLMDNLYPLFKAIKTLEKGK